MTMHSQIVEDLVALVLGDLDSSQAAALEARVERTPEARRLLDQIRVLVKSLQTDDGATPPDALVHRVKALMGAATSAAAPVTHRTVREILATLVFDSFGRVAVAGFRGTVADRQLAYSSDAADIDLQVATPDRERRTIRGQVASAGAPASEVAISRPGDDAPLASAPVDSRGMFSLESAPGSYDLRVRIGDELVLLPTLTID